MPEDGVKSSSTGKARLYALDLLRGLCALSVALYHLSTWTEAPLPASTREILTLCGTYGVSLFFVLSGYSLSHVYANVFRETVSRKSVLHYLRRRIGRLGPLFAMVALLPVVYGYLVIDRPFEAEQMFVLMANLTLIFGFVTPMATNVVGGWSIGVEVVFYVIFPLLMLLRKEAKYLISISVFLTLWIAHDLLSFGTLSEGVATYVQPANHAVFFVCGVYIKFAQDQFKTSDAYFTAGTWVLVLVLMVGVALDSTALELVTGWRRAILVCLSIVMVAAVAQLTLSGQAAKFCALMGSLSYPLYLIHPVVYAVLKRYLDMSIPWMFIVLLLISGLTALSLDRMFDAPVQRRLKAAGW